MGRRILPEDELGVILEKITQIKSVPTWTREKHNLKRSFLEFVRKNYKRDFYEADRRIKAIDGEQFHAWKHEVRLVHEKQRGFLKKYRGRKVIILCIYTYKWGNRELLVIPLKKPA